MKKYLSSKRVVFGVVIVAIMYVVIITGINICNESYRFNNKGIFTDEFSHNVFHKTTQNI